jgi:hypothetical protein
MAPSEMMGTPPTMTGVTATGAMKKKINSDSDGSDEEEDQFSNKTFD